MANRDWQHHELFRQWVEDAKKQLGVKKIPDVAVAIGLKSSTLNTYTQPGAAIRPGPKTLKALGDLLGRDYKILMPDGDIPADNPDSDTILVPWYHTHAAAGNGTFIEPEDSYLTRGMEFPKSFLRHTLNVTPCNARLFTIKGDSMEPTLKNGEFVIVDLGTGNGDISDGIWLFEQDNTVMVKRIQWTNDGFKAISDNKDYTPFSIGDNFNVIGRVVFTGRRL